jgi:hypothetical protein
VSLINTNVLRQGSAYDANVSAAMFTINDKTQQIFYVEGAGKVELRYCRKPNKEQIEPATAMR